ncbi:MAG TPA: SDR family NAD(P)-dependent oxidoreductase [Anaerolineales bacterium]|nr:SDR family NAD(P)-dependent oxidoreductase [Anaerolineales bacterium]
MSHARAAAATSPADVLASFRLDDRVAMVTGAGRGLGRGMAVALAAAGADVAICDVNPEDLSSVEAEIGAMGRRVHAAVIDVGAGPEVERFVSEIAAGLGRLDVLVNNAGVTSGSPFEELGEEDWEHVLRVNLGGIYRCSKWAARQFIRQGRGGSIVNMASISGLVGNRGGNNSHYCASKGGVIALTRSLAVEWARHRIRVNAIAPGYFVTPMTDRLKQRDAAFYQELIGRVPLGRFGEPEDLAGAVVFLASEASSFVSGHVLVVDGGYTAW